MAVDVGASAIALSRLHAVILLWPRSCIFEPRKNKMNESMFLHADERIRIVDRYIITVKLQIRALNANIWRARGRIRTPIWADSEPVSSVADWRNVGNA